MDWSAKIRSYMSLICIFNSLLKSKSFPKASILAVSVFFALCSEMSDYCNIEWHQDMFLLTFMVLIGNINTIRSRTSLFTFYNTLLLAKARLIVTKKRLFTTVKPMSSQHGNIFYCRTGVTTFTGVSFSIFMNLFTPLSAITWGSLFASLKILLGNTSEHQ